MHSKLRIKIGAIEFEYEGEAEFTQEAIKDLFSHMEAVARAEPGFRFNPGSNMKTDSAQVPGATRNQNLHTNSIAAKLGVKTATDLAIASAAHLQIVNRNMTFTRANLLADMKNASNYYKVNMASNMTKVLKTLVTGNRFTQSAKNTYSLSGPERERVEGVLAS